MESIGDILLHISASLLSSDQGCLAEEMARAERGGVDSVHIDVMDGHYVRNLTFGPGVVRCLRKRTALPIWVHLEIENPELFIEDFAEAGADMIIFHWETCAEFESLIQRIRGLRLQVGLALKPEHRLDVVERSLGDVDLLLMMSVAPGCAGQDFQPRVLSKVASLRELIERESLAIDVGVDGGVNEATAFAIARAGANVFVVGSALYESEDLSEATERLRRSISSGWLDRGKSLSKRRPG